MQWSISEMVNARAFKPLPLCSASLKTYICLLYICIVLDLAVSVVVCKASVLDWLGGGSICLIYMHCPRSSRGCSSMQGICTWLTGGHLPSIYLHCPRSSSGCSSIQGICAWLTGEDLCLIALCYANIFGVAVCKASVLDWLGGHLPSIYLHCPRSSSGCSSMQGICAWLTGEDLCLIALCYANIFGVAVCKASVLDWLGGICLLYICIFLDLAVSVVVCKASVLD